MTIRDRKALRQTAARRLSRASYKPRRLVLIHSGVMLGAALLMAVLDYIITWQIDANGGGLSGMQLRSILETAGNVLSVAYGILMPFWSMGFVYATIRLARGKAAWPGSLLEGFRRKGPVLRLILLQILIYGAITFAAMYASSFLYSMTPDGQAFCQALLKLMETQQITDYVQLMEAIPQPVIEQVASVYLPIMCVVLLVLLTPAYYRMRMAAYLVMDEDGVGAWKAVRTSGKIMRRNGFRLFLLDLSYWWYYLIPMLLIVPAYADVLLPLLKLELPVDPAVLYIAGNVIYVLLSLIFECAARPRVQTTYALAYDALLDAYRQANPQQTSQVVDSTGYPVRNEE